MRAHIALMYLRWQNADVNGNSPVGYRGESFDLHSGSALQGVQVREPAASGQGGKWGQDTFDWSWREWLRHVIHADLMWILGGSLVVGAGCKPLREVSDLRPGMVGELWDVYVSLALALAGAEHRVVWFHHSS